MVAAPIFKRIAETTLRHLGIGPTINPEPPVLVERRDPANARTSAPNPGAPIISLVAGDDALGTIPDLQGLSAREAVRRLVRLGLTAQLTGDGFVMSQDPPAGTALEPGAVCHLVLARVVGGEEQVATP